MGTQGYHAEVLRTVADLNRVAGDWDRLAARWGTPLLKADWFLACAETLCRESDLRVIVVRRQGTPCAIAPLMLARRGGVEQLEVLGSSVLYEPTGLIYDDPDSLRYLLASILGCGTAAVFDRIPADSPIASELRRVAGLRGVVITRNTASAAYVVTNGTWDKCFRSLSAKTRYEFKRLRRQMERTGPVVVRIEQPASRAHLEALLQDLLRVEAAGWKGRSGTAMATNDQIRRFIIRYSERMCERHMLRFSFLDVAGDPIAASLSVQDAQRFWGLKIGYLEEWARCAPGVQLTMDTLKYAFESGLEAYEFLGSEESWQARWPVHRHTYVSVVLYPFSFSGGQAFAGDLARFVLKRARGLLRPAACGGAAMFGAKGNMAWPSLI